LRQKKKSIYKLPTWFNTPFIYFPRLLSIEQCSSETTAKYKASLALGNTLIDLTAGFGVDSYFFSKKVKTVYSCEINSELAGIAAHNAKILGSNNINSMPEDGIAFLKDTALTFDTIYIDPARRSENLKVFKLKDCTPDVTLNLDLFLKKAKRIIIKTAPLLDISAGLSELKNVSEIHIVSVKNECKELLWIIDEECNNTPTIVCTALNSTIKTIFIPSNQIAVKAKYNEEALSGYLYEPDVALLKSGAFNWIGEKFGLKKLHPQSQLYVSEELKPDFIGRIFKIEAILNINELKKEKGLIGNVIVRNFPERAENLVKKYNIKSSHDDFILFTQTLTGYIVIKATIVQHY
jgi:16S rRNA G966 N2-methylase RsmD